MRRGAIVHRMVGGGYVAPGDTLIVMDAADGEREMVAASTLLADGDGGAVVWVREPDRSDEYAVPWPERYLRRPELRP